MGSSLKKPTNFTYKNMNLMNLWSSRPKGISIRKHWRCYIGTSEERKSVNMNIWALILSITLLLIFIPSYIYAYNQKELTDDELEKIKTYEINKRKENGEDYGEEIINEAISSLFNKEKNTYLNEYNNDLATFYRSKEIITDEHPVDQVNIAANIIVVFCGFMFWVFFDEDVGKEHQQIFPEWSKYYRTDDHAAEMWPKFAFLYGLGIGIFAPCIKYLANDKSKDYFANVSPFYPLVFLSMMFAYYIFELLKHTFRGFHKRTQHH
jgi:hypothetical protein